MFPASLALIDGDPDLSDRLSSRLRDCGVVVRPYPGGSDLLVDPAAYEFDFYVLDLRVPGVDGVELIRILRRRSSAGILVVSGRASTDDFGADVEAGADMYLAKPVPVEQVVLAVKAVQRRAVVALSQASSWQLDPLTAELVAPDNVRIALSETDMRVMQCFVEAAGQPVSRELLRERLGHGADEGSDNGLHATIYRLRRRIERATPTLVPLQAQSRVGYRFRAPLVAR